jgi:hypothetical protein
MLVRLGRRVTEQGVSYTFSAVAAAVGEDVQKCCCEQYLWHVTQELVHNASKVAEETELAEYVVMEEAAAALEVES